MKIGALNVAIKIQVNEVVEDEIGNHTSEWKDYFSCYATLSSQKGSESLEAGHLVSFEALFLTVRYCSETACVCPLCYRIVMDEIIYNIVSINPMGFHKKSLKFYVEKEERS